MRAANPRTPIAWILACTLSTASLAQSFDPAAELPPDTLAFISWSRAEQDAVTELSLVGGLVEALARLDDQPKQATTIRAGFDLVSTLLAERCTLAVIHPKLTIDEHSRALSAEIALVCEAGSLATKIDADLRAFLNRVGLSVSDVTVAGAKFARIPLGGTDSLLFGPQNGRFIAATSEAVAAEMAATAPKPGFSENAEWKRFRERFAGDGNLRCAGFVDLGYLAQAGRKIADSDDPDGKAIKKVLAALHTDDMKSICFQTATRKDGPLSRCWVHVEGGPRGIFKAWDQKPLTDDDLRIVPKNAYWAQVCNLDLEKLWNDGMAIVDECDEDARTQLESMLATGDAFLGFSAVNGLLPDFGDTWAVFDAPDQGGILGLGTVIVAEIRKPEMVQQAVTRLVQLLAPPMKEEKLELSVRTSRVGAVTVNVIVLGGLPVPVAPSWAIVGDRVVMGLFPQTVAAAARQVDPKTRGESLLDRAQFKAGRAALGVKSAMSVGFEDAEATARAIYPLWMLYATATRSVIAGTAGAAEVAAFPTLAASIQGLRDCVGACSLESDGILYSSTGGASGVFRYLAMGALVGSITSATTGVESTTNGPR